MNERHYNKHARRRKKREKIKTFLKGYETKHTRKEFSQAA